MKQPSIPEIEEKDFAWVDQALADKRAGKVPKGDARQLLYSDIVERAAELKKEASRLRQMATHREIKAEQLLRAGRSIILTD